MNAASFPAIPPRRPDYRLRPSLQWTHVIGRWNSWWVLSDPATGEHYRCGDREADIARRLGQTDAATLQSRPAVLRALLSVDLAYDASRTQQIDSRESPLAAWRGFAQGLAAAAGRIFYQQVALPVPQRYVAAAARSSGWLFSTQAAAWWSAWAIFSFAVFAVHCLGRSLASIGEFGAAFPVGFGLASAAAIFVLTRTVHELAHAVVCVRAGGRCRRWGMVRVGVVAFPYVDVSDAWKMPRAASRIGVAAAGVYAECIVASLAVWIAMVLPGTLIASLAWQTVLITLGGSLLFNANPLMRYDGYYVFSELCELPDPHASARRMVAAAFKKASSPFGRSDRGGRESLRQVVAGRMPLAVAAAVPIFAVASVAYRCMLLFAAATAVLITMHRLSLGDVGWFLVSAAAASTAVPWLLGRGGGPRRTIVATVSLATAAYVCFCVPLPYRFTAAGSVVSADRVAIYPPGNGTLGSVTQGEAGLRVTLLDEDLERRLLDAEQRLAEATAREQTMERAVYTQPEVLERLPQARLIREIRQRQSKALHDREAMRELVIEAGLSFLPLPLPLQSHEANLIGREAAASPAIFDLARSTSRTVLDPASRGVAIDAARPLGYAAVEGSEPQVEVFVAGECFSEVWVGQQVRAIFEQDATRVWSGRVQAVSQLTSRRGVAEETAMGHYISIALEDLPRGGSHAEGGHATVVFTGRPRTLAATLKRGRG